jgi:hypothetical protein
MVLRSLDFQRGDIESERAGRGLNFAQLQRGGGIADIDQNRQPVQTGDNLAQEFEALSAEIGSLGGEAGNVAPWSRKGLDEAIANRVSRRREHDRDGRCGLLRSEG